MKSSLASRKRRRGAALLEFALVASLFFALLLGMLQFGVYLNATNTLWNLSREAARFASVQRDDNPAANQKIIDHITKPAPDGMLPPTVNPNKLTITIEPLNYKDRGKGTEVKITLQYDMSDKLFVPMGSMLSKGYQTTTSMMVE